MHGKNVRLAQAVGIAFGAAVLHAITAIVVQQAFQNVKEAL